MVYGALGDEQTQVLIRRNIFSCVWRYLVPGKGSACADAIAKNREKTVLIFILLPQEWQK